MAPARAHASLNPSRSLTRGGISLRAQKTGGALPGGLAMFDLTGKVAVVTGGTGVLGSCMCKGLAAAGAKVAVVGRREAVAKEIADAILADGGAAMPLPADVTDQASCEAAAAALQKAWGTVDILVNAAGGNQPGATIGPDKSFCEHFSTEAFDQITKLNLVGTVRRPPNRAPAPATILHRRLRSGSPRGVLLCVQILPCKIFGAIMEAKKEGVIINISSMAAQQTITRVCGYSASKAAIDNFTKWLAVELATKLGDKYPPPPPSRPPNPTQRGQKNRNV